MHIAQVIVTTLEPQALLIFVCVYRHLYTEAKKLWDTVTLSDIPTESTTIDVLEELVEHEGRVLSISHPTVCPVIDLPSSVEDFKRQIGSRARSNLKQTLKSLDQAGEAEHQVLDSQDFDKQMEEIVKLHQMRWLGKGTGGAFESTRFLDFHQEVTRLFNEKGFLQLDFLKLGGETIAGVYGYAYDDRFYYYLPGFNPERVPKASPGILLLFYCIERAIRHGYREFDLLRGLENYKLAWSNRLRRCLQLRFYNRGVRPAVLQSFESLKSVVKTLIR